MTKRAFFCVIGGNRIAEDIENRFDAVNFNEWEKYADDPSPEQYEWVLNAPDDMDALLAYVGWLEKMMGVYKSLLESERKKTSDA